LSAEEETDTDSWAPEDVEETAVVAIDKALGLILGEPKDPAGRSSGGSANNCPKDVERAEERAMDDGSDTGREMLLLRLCDREGVADTVLPRLCRWSKDAQDGAWNIIVKRD